MVWKGLREWAVCIVRSCGYGHVYYDPNADVDGIERGFFGCREGN